MVFFIGISMLSCKNKTTVKPAETNTTLTEYYTEPFRPQYHFSPEEKWMNDPNGMVYKDGVYHLFYQYYPDDIVWGPMHWGHAVSKNLVHWKHKPIALFPDRLGYIFSGSTVVDYNNTSGFGTVENPPLVAIFTYHLAEGEKTGKNDFQTQGIAYSLDNGDTWVKYEGNPVIGNKDIRDFRDPKVIWHEPSKHWVLTLVAGNHAKFYTSENLKEWDLMSEFGADKGAHGGVWECPDLFPIKVSGSDEEKWVLLISINPGAPNGGSGTQYFIGDFDGTKFETSQQETKWIDWGTDNYAGVTYSNAPNNERIFIGWMSNWNYAQKTPTLKWRSAMTLPRKFSLKKNNDDFTLYNYPVENVDKLKKVQLKKEIAIPSKGSDVISYENFNQAEIRFKTTSKDFKLSFMNESDEVLVMGALAAKQKFFIDRQKSGVIDFQDGFGNLQQMPIPNLPNAPYEVRILMDKSSVEIFINEGQYVMTAQLFPIKSYTRLKIENLGVDALLLSDFEVSKVKGIW